MFDNLRKLFSTGLHGAAAADDDVAARSTAGDDGSGIEHVVVSTGKTNDGHDDGITTIRDDGTPNDNDSGHEGGTKHGVTWMDKGEEKGIDRRSVAVAVRSLNATTPSPSNDGFNDTETPRVDDGIAKDDDNG